ncbi:PREDICTED: cuticle protein-like [Papilio xuthus]|uniref:Cuticle protein-like n=1 Tax=Papilio xuthus TaxID=66420 RepID=A0AAJ6Z164_PAPXU|nr:PREDICTED: cuticle protein-like [Papilio xuthus]
MKLYLAVTCLLALTAVSNADGTLDGLIYAPGHSSVDYYTYPSYAFEYAVKDPHTGDNKAQWEKRDGDSVKGAYSLVEPDGSIRVVEYWADAKSGFNAVVKRIGPNLHPVAAPIYKAPIPLLSNGPAVTPISVGSVAKIEALASAPLVSGSSYGGAVSSSTLYKAAPIVKSVAPIAPIAPIYTGPIYKAPIISQPIITQSYEKAPLPNPILAEPIYKSLSIPAAPIKLSPLLDPGLLAPWPLLKGTEQLPSISLGDYLLKDSLLAGNGYDLGYDAHGASWDSLGLGYKH